MTCNVHAFKFVVVSNHQDQIAETHRVCKEIWRPGEAEKLPKPLLNGLVFFCRYLYLRFTGKSGPSFARLELLAVTSHIHCLHVACTNSMVVN